MNTCLLYSAIVFATSAGSSELSDPLNQLKLFPSSSEDSKDPTNGTLLKNIETLRPEASNESPTLENLLGSQLQNDTEREGNIPEDHGMYKDIELDSLKEIRNLNFKANKTDIIKKSFSHAKKNPTYRRVVEHPPPPSFPAYKYEVIPLADSKSNLNSESQSTAKFVEQNKSSLLVPLNRLKENNFHIQPELPYAHASAFQILQGTNNDLGISKTDEISYLKRNNEMLNEGFKSHLDIFTSPNQTEYQNSLMPPDVKFSFSSLIPSIAGNDSYITKVTSYTTTHKPNPSLWDVIPNQSEYLIPPRQYNIKEKTNTGSPSHSLDPDPNMKKDINNLFDSVITPSHVKFPNNDFNLNKNLVPDIKYKWDQFNVVNESETTLKTKYLEALKEIYEHVLHSSNATDS